MNHLILFFLEYEFLILFFLCNQYFFSNYLAFQIIRVFSVITLVFGSLSTIIWNRLSVLAPCYGCSHVFYNFLHVSASLLSFNDRLVPFLQFFLFNFALCLQLTSLGLNLRDLLFKKREFFHFLSFSFSLGHLGFLFFLEFLELFVFDSQGLELLFVSFNLVLGLDHLFIELISPKHFVYMLYLLFKLLNVGLMTHEFPLFLS
jgi:hypothetical protein